MVYLAECWGSIAGLYNLALVIILMFLFAKFIKKPNKKVYMKPWKILFFVLWIYIAEEVFNVIELINIYIPKVVYPILEMVMITAFIYMLLLQKEHLKKLFKKKKKR